MPVKFRDCCAVEFIPDYLHEAEAGPNALQEPNIAIIVKTSTIGRCKQVKCYKHLLSGDPGGRRI
jgi:hypothetical protein